MNSHLQLQLYVKCSLEEAVVRLLYLSAGVSVSSCLSVETESLPHYLSVSSSATQENGSRGKKKVTEEKKSEMRSNLMLIWFLLGSCFNPLWAGFFSCVSNSQGLEWRVADSHCSQHRQTECWTEDEWQYSVYVYLLDYFITNKLALFISLRDNGFIKGRVHPKINSWSTHWCVLMVTGRLCVGSFSVVCCDLEENTASDCR